MLEFQLRMNLRDFIHQMLDKSSHGLVNVHSFPRKEQVILSRLSGSTLQRKSDVSLLLLPGGRVLMVALIQLPVIIDLPTLVTFAF